MTASQSRLPHCLTGETSYWLSVAGTSPGIFSRSTIVLTTPVKTRRSLARMTSSGPTGPRTFPSRSISIKNRPGNCRNPAVATVLFANRQPG